MKTIKSNLENEIIIKNSKFITYIYRINSSDITNYLEKIKSIHPKATHYTYAYIYNDIKRCSDDNEPSNTAGSPMLNVLEKENLFNILVITVRYFGGIKLGVGGLVRAYTNSVCESLNSATIISLTKGIQVEIEFKYEDLKQIDYLLKDYEIVNKDYNNNIKYIINIPEDINIKEILNNFIINYKEIDNILITKKEDTI